ncbi:hypothetical protein [Frigoribacterium sp. CFBP9030]|uniref:hypothetical protein n=1 Tax=Frigoribacterium sp. CFBP9030 TaxID=3096537 RepID=UPI002A6AF531|nr:hypothetical protein [Frigoribacterium sp. CFBP9030]MDY0891848.1 hypothetical protein [Frigoribacterium sp. CFBP9030]
MADAEEIAVEVLRERDRQDSKWGEQNHPDGTGGDRAIRQAEWAKQRTDLRAEEGTVTWLVILREEVLEAFAESDPTKLRDELIQVAAVAQQWVQAIDRRSADS